MGNIREVWNGVRKNYSNQVKELASTRQRTQYYPSGLPWAESFGAAVQKHKYNDKEFIEMHGLDEYDSEARWYIPSSVRTPTIDPHCESYYDTSPYAWCGNNFVNAIDPDGRDWYSYQEEYTDNEGKKQTRTAYKYVEGQMSKKEMKEGGYTHLGLTYTKGDTYYSLFGTIKDMKTVEGKLYQKVDEAIISYYKGIEDEKNAKSDIFNSELINYNYQIDFTIEGYEGKAVEFRFTYENSSYGKIQNFLSRNNNKAKNSRWLTNPETSLGGGGTALPKGYYIHFENGKNAHPLILIYNLNHKNALLKKLNNLFPNK